MDSTGESFEAIRAALADRNNILTVKDLCELAGVSRPGCYNWVRFEKNRELREAKETESFGRRRTGRHSNRSWRHTGSGATQRAFAAFICGFCTWVSE